MRKAILLLLVFNAFCAQAQREGEIDLGVLQSVGKNSWKLISSSSQAVGINAPVRLRYNSLGIRARLTISEHLSSTLKVFLTTGLNYRREEALTFSPVRFSYVSVPVQAGMDLKLFIPRRSIFSFRAYSGVNIFKLEDELSQRETGLIHNLEVKYSWRGRGFINSYHFKGGFELEVDNETFFYRSTDPFFKDENFHFKVKRNQLYVSAGISI